MTPSQIYARREGWNAVFTTAKEPLAPWHGTVNDFRDPHLLELTAPVAEIEVHGPKDFTLQRQGTNDWKIVGEKFPVDAENVQLFIKTAGRPARRGICQGRGDGARSGRLRA